MKSFLLSLLLFAVLAVGCAHGPCSPSTPAPPPASLQPQQATVVPNSEQSPLKSPEMSAKEKGGHDQNSSELGIVSPERSVVEVGKGIQEETATISEPPASSVSPEMSAEPENESVAGNESIDYLNGEAVEERAEIADPLEPFNRAMYHFNDKLYFWVLKPVAQGYRKVVPENARVSVGNFFSNLTFPIRFVNCLLQANFGGAASELGRFMVNTICGIGGFLDIASSKSINLLKQDEDFGQTLGVYGLGHGFYITWPLLGPSSPRDTVGLVGDLFLNPFSYLNPWGIPAGIKAYDRVNDTSLRIGDYESLKEAAIDPYVAIRDAYVQYRQKKVKARGLKPALSKPVK